MNSATLKVFAFTLLISSCTRTQQSIRILEGSDLEVGIEIQSELTAQSADTFRLNLPARTFISGNAEQITVDVVVNILDSAKKSVSGFDDAARGPEPFILTARKAGIYYIVISPFQQQEGKYSLKIGSAEPLAMDPGGRVDQIARSLTDENGPGFSIAIARDGETIYKNSFGLANLEYSIPNTQQTIFHIASVSKQFTAFSIAMLVSQGKLSLDDDIRKYLPEIHDFGTPITINHLIHHTSGLRDQWNLLMIAGWRLDDVIRMDHIIKMMARQRELNFHPGAEFLYCNTGFTFLAEIVGRVTGTPFPEWTKQNIFEPLGMNRTLFYDDHEKVVENRAYSYYKPDSVYKKRVLSYANFGATSLFTTVEDIMKWAANFETMTVGNPKVMAMMEEKFVLNNGDTIDYGFGQGIGEYKGLKTVSHGGADAGYRTTLIRFPEERVSIAVFSNLGSFSPNGFAYAAADEFLIDQLVEEPEDEDSENPGAPQASEDLFDRNTVKLADYAGRFYSEEIQSFYDIRVENDTVLMAHHQRNPDIVLNAVAPDEFRGNMGWMGNVKFTRNGKGKVTEMLISNGRVRNLSFKREGGVIGI
jgi:CubicO group peptidase (beta-lactamase class C family)